MTIKRKSTPQGKPQTIKSPDVSEISKFSGFDFDYDPAPESSSVVDIKSEYGHFINGKFTKPKRTFETLNPSNEDVLSRVSEGDTKDIDLAVSAAEEAHKKTWSKMTGKDRGKYLFRIARMIQERSRELAVLETLDNGKPIKESRDVDIPLAAAHFFYYAGWADKLNYAFPGQSVKSLGIAGQVIPWNFPLLMAAWKLAPALATGNCVVLKPAETTPLTALLLAEIIQEAELPDGVVNIVTGAGMTGAALVAHPKVKKIAFTGSTEIGRKIADACAPTDKKLTLELGGKSAHIVLEDAAIDQAVEGVINGIYFNQGHVCCAGSRLLVQESIAKTFVEKLKFRMKSLRVGDPMDKNTDIGAINSKEQLTKIQDIVEAGKVNGADYFEPESIQLPKRGYYHKPCFFNHVSASSPLSRLEIFGPVLAISTFRSPSEAVSKANDTAYGLAAGIWSEKGSKIHEIASKLKAGVIWANTYNKFDPSSPFGGYRESGWGREGGKHGLIPYVEISE